MQRLIDIKTVGKKWIQTGFPDIDRLLSGGFLPGMVMLLAGNPGIGKSTLLLQIASSLKQPTLYIAGEESPEQIRYRADRVGSIPPTLSVLPELNVDAVVAAIETHKPAFVVIDSIQTMWTSDLLGAAGSIGQVRECASRLTIAAKRVGAAMAMIGHVTKTGAVAGPMTLEHIVDTVVMLEGEERLNLRILHVLKHRFGATDETAFFSMNESGFVPASDPSRLFFSEETVGRPGMALVPALHGRRPLMVEIQALTAPTVLSYPRRVSVGLETERLHVLLAVLLRHGRVDLGTQDVFMNVVGGLSLQDPGVDLAVCMAVYSGFRGRAVPGGVAFIGEVGLLGELRPPLRLADRVKEAKRFEISRLVGPNISARDGWDVRTLEDCLGHVFEERGHG